METTTVVADRPPEMTTTRLPRDLVRMALVVAEHRDISVAELLDPVIRPWLSEEYRKTANRMLAEASPVELGGESG